MFLGPKFKCPLLAKTDAADQSTDRCMRRYPPAQIAHT
ncbi:protein of unknown function (plasmid) [Caballeronia sp. S22]